ncbi:MAG: hypothetical protein EZS28_022149 [Streblomastix strix]|uniref:Uncharacterized protein n=1 Tax=Streblomastix strix TaxID=222440 RepID=A0A5J4VIN2_9EUKA|nr:MAG: hypothetical protein EZS28_022149 [Streblomastix strix]
MKGEIDYSIIKPGSGKLLQKENPEQKVAREEKERQERMNKYSLKEQLNDELKNEKRQAGGVLLSSLRPNPLHIQDQLNPIKNSSVGAAPPSLSSLGSTFLQMPNISSSLINRPIQNTSVPLTYQQQLNHSLAQNQAEKHAQSGGFQSEAQASQIGSFSEVLDVSNDRNMPQSLRLSYHPDSKMNNPHKMLILIEVLKQVEVEEEIDGQNSNRVCREMKKEQEVHLIVWKLKEIEE